MPVCRIDYLRVAWQTSQERGTTFGLVGECLQVRCLVLAGYTVPGRSGLMS